MNPDAKCEDCRYWQYEAEKPMVRVDLSGDKPNEDFSAAIGRCRYWPPMAAQNRNIHEWPITFKGDWCGKFEARNQTQESTGPK